jgi:hypothetical protein
MIASLADEATRKMKINYPSQNAANQRFLPRSRREREAEAFNRRATRPRGGALSEEIAVSFFALRCSISALLRCIFFLPSAFSSALDSVPQGQERLQPWLPNFS